jgi:uroporphyrinogen-III synthase
VNTDLPLTGRTLIVTRATDQAGTLAGALAQRGARVVELPVIAVADPADGGAALVAAVADLDAYDWVVVTSPNGARGVADRLGGTIPSGTRFAAIGPRTAVPLLAAGAAVDLVPGRAVAEGLLDEFPAPPDTGGRVLLARAEVARDVLPDGLRAAGWDVDVVVAYRNVEPDTAPDVLAAAMAADAVVFTAESTVRRYTALAGSPTPVDAVCIGPVSATAARELGYRVVTAEPHSVEGLVDAACAWAAG